MTSTPTRPVMHEPTAWLRGALAYVLARIDELDLDLSPSDDVVTTLGPAGAPGDRTCDRCRTDVPMGPLFYVDRLTPRLGVHVVVGLCQVCRDLGRGEVR